MLPHLHPNIQAPGPRRWIRQRETALASRRSQDRDHVSRKGYPMTTPLPYCGLPPLPGELLSRFNLDPVLMLALAALALLQIRYTADSRRWAAGAGWALAAAALLSPLCALSVSLFAARVGQHMVLILLAAPLIAFAWPRRSGRLHCAGLW